ncbi:hypothetical protein Tco_1158895, partial [Tanacetum coccineum]
MLSKMRVPRRDKSFSWDKRKGQSMSVKDAGVISSALSSLQKKYSKSEEPLSRTDGGRLHFVVQCITFPYENFVLALE